MAINPKFLLCVVCQRPDAAPFDFYQSDAALAEIREAREEQARQEWAGDQYIDHPTRALLCEHHARSAAELNLSEVPIDQGLARLRQSLIPADLEVMLAGDPPDGTVVYAHARRMRIRKRLLLFALGLPVAQFAYLTLLRDGSPWVMLAVGVLVLGFAWALVQRWRSLGAYWQLEQGHLTTYDGQTATFPVSDIVHTDIHLGELRKGAQAWHAEVVTRDGSRRRMAYPRIDTRSWERITYAIGATIAAQRLTEIRDHGECRFGSLKVTTTTLSWCNVSYPLDPLQRVTLDRSDNTIVFHFKPPAKPLAVAVDEVRDHWALTRVLWRLAPNLHTPHFQVAPRS